MQQVTQIVFILITSIIFFLPPSATGQDKTYYTALKAGAYFPSGDLDDDFDFDTGFNGEIQFGNHFMRNLALEWGIGYFESESRESGNFTDPILGTISGSADLDLWAIPVTLTPKGYFFLENLELYAGVGIGVYFVNLAIDASGTISGPLGTTMGSISEDDDDTIIGGHVLTGANYFIASNIFIGVIGKYIFTEEAEFFNIEFANLNGFIVTGNIGFRY